MPISWYISFLVFVFERHCWVVVAVVVEINCYRHIFINIDDEFTSQSNAENCCSCFYFETLLLATSTRYARWNIWHFRGNNGFGFISFSLLSLHNFQYRLVRLINSQLLFHGRCGVPFFFWLYVQLSSNGFDSHRFLINYSIVKSIGCKKCFVISWKNAIFWIVKAEKFERKIQ